MPFNKKTAIILATICLATSAAILSTGRPSSKRDSASTDERSYQAKHPSHLTEQDSRSDSGTSPSGAAVPDASSQRSRRSNPNVGVLSTAEAPGERTVAKISNQGAEQALLPNEIGFFPRVYIQPNQEVPVELNYPDGLPEEAVSVHVEDGGALDGRLPGKLYRLDEGNSMAFRFRANADEGVYRVAIRKGSDVRVLEFWVGEEQPVARR